MSDNDSSTPTDASTQPAPEAKQAETFTKEYVQELRNEAAKYRIEKNEAVEQAKAAVAADFQKQMAEKDVALAEAQNQLGQAWIEMEKLYVSLDAKVPSERVRAFAEILKGEDPETIRESAKSAKELFTGLETKSPAIDPTQGSGGGVVPLNGDPLLNALKKVVGI